MSTSLREFRPSLWWFGVVFFFERFVRFSIFMGVLWFDLVAILAMIWGANSRPHDRRLVFWMRALMVWSLASTVVNIYQMAIVPELEGFSPEQQALGRIYLNSLLSVRLVWSAINLYLLVRDQRSIPSSSSA